MRAREILAGNLRTMRTQRGLSQEALADIAGIDRTYVSALERKRYAASIDMLERLAEALRCTSADLLTATDQVEGR